MRSTHTSAGSKTCPSASTTVPIALCLPRGPERPVPSDHRPVHHAPLLVVRYGAVLRRAVVPEGHRVRPPTEPALQLGGFGVLEQVGEHSVALALLKLHDPGGEVAR